MDRHEPQPGSDPTSSSAARWRLSQGTQTHSASFTDDPEDNLVDIRHNQGEVGGGEFILQCWHAWLRCVFSVEADATDQVVTHPSQPPQNDLTRLEILRRAKYFDAKEAGAAAADRLPRSFSTRSIASDGHTHRDNGSTYQTVPPARDVSPVRKGDIIQQSGYGSWDLSGGLFVSFWWHSVDQGAHRQWQTPSTGVGFHPLLQIGVRYFIRQTKPTWMDFRVRQSPIAITTVMVVIEGRATARTTKRTANLAKVL